MDKSKLELFASKLRENGICIETGFSVESPDGLLLSLAKMIGQVKSYLSQPLIMDIKPKKGYEPQSSGGTDYIGPHSDLAWYKTPPQFIAMICLDPGEATDGRATAVDALSVFKKMPQNVKSDLEREKVFFPAPSHTEFNGFEGPIVSKQEEYRMLRFNSRNIRDSLSESGKLFLNELESKQQEYLLEKGMLIAYNNHHYFHGRTRVEKGASTSRWLKRIYFNEA